MDAHKYSADVLLFNSFQRLKFSGIDGVNPKCRLAVVPNPLREIIDNQFFKLRQRDGPFDYVSEFTNIAGPI